MFVCFRIKSLSLPVHLFEYFACISFLVFSCPHFTGIETFFIESCIQTRPQTWRADWLVSDIFNLNASWESWFCFILFITDNILFLSFYCIEIHKEDNIIYTFFITLRVTPPISVCLAVCLAVFSFNHYHIVLRCFTACFGCFFCVSFLLYFLRFCFFFFFFIFFAILSPTTFVALPSVCFLVLLVL